MERKWKISENQTDKKQSWQKVTVTANPANIYLFKFNKRNTKKMCEMYSKSTKKTQNDVGEHPC